MPRLETPLGGLTDGESVRRIERRGEEGREEGPGLALGVPTLTCWVREAEETARQRRGSEV